VTFCYHEYVCYFTCSVVLCLLVIQFGLNLSLDWLESIKGNLLTYLQTNNFSRFRCLVYSLRTFYCFRFTSHVSLKVKVVLSRVLFWHYCTLCLLFGRYSVSQYIDIKLGHSRLLTRISAACWTETTVIASSSHCCATYRWHLRVSGHCGVTTLYTRK